MAVDSCHENGCVVTLFGGVLVHHDKRRDLYCGVQVGAATTPQALALVLRWTRDAVHRTQPAGWRPATHTVPGVN